MTIRELCSQIAKLEGKKHAASIGDVREIVGLIADQVYAEFKGECEAGTMLALENLGQRRAKKQRK